MILSDPFFLHGTNEFVIVPFQASCMQIITVNTIVSVNLLTHAIEI